MILTAYNSEISTALFTLAGGIVLYILSRSFEIKVFQPIYNYNQLKGRVKYLLVLHADKFGNKDAWLNKDSKDNEFYEGLEEIRKIASELYSFAYTNNLARSLSFYPSKRRLLDAASNLIALSNSAKGNYEFIEERKNSVKAKLKL